LAEASSSLASTTCDKQRNDAKTRNIINCRVIESLSPVN
jgi:hypothetical protein